MAPPRSTSSDAIRGRLPRPRAHRVVITKADLLDPSSRPRTVARSDTGERPARRQYAASPVTTALAVGAALVALVLGLALTERWLVRRRRHDLSWAIAFGLFVAGATALAWGSSNGWSAASFRVFYLCGAIANVPFLAAGQIELLGAGRTPGRYGRAARAARPLAALFGAFSAGVIAVAPLRHAVPPDRLPQGSSVFGALPHVLAGVGSGVSATIVFVGTAWATWGAARAGVRRRAFGTALIAGGTLVLSSSGVLNSVFGAMRAFAVTLTLGVTILFAGFVLATT